MIRRNTDFTECEPSFPEQKDDEKKIVANLFTHGMNLELSCVAMVTIILALNGY